MLRKKNSATSSPTAAVTICDLCDLYTSKNFDGKWADLADVYDKRRNVDNFREILVVSIPTDRLNGLNGWHLERMAVGELEPGAELYANDLATCKRESRVIKKTLMKVIANSLHYKAKRNELEVAMDKQREALAVELKMSKEFLSRLSC
ncbi:uncharacterized protein CCR75_008736 [Bremia lactucae]|uniref:Uncharacterized protein n=1 Tax=Bremia lactucae TaxID=4779 RepID=A0A976FPM8_BRELC|nr:hypothetical protein CCR75_008736 [Bremia lactucae]